MKTTLDKYDKIWEINSVLLLLTQALIIALTLPSLPDKVGIHFNILGQADAWGNKKALWLSVGLSVFIYIFLTIVSNRPGLYKSRMTANNLEEQYRLTSKMARAVKCFILIAFIILTIFMLMNADGKWTNKSPFLFLIFFALVIPPCIYYALKISRVQ